MMLCMVCMLLLLHIIGMFAIDVVGATVLCGVVDVLVALDVVALSPDVITDTIGAVLKYQDDIAKITGGPATRILEQIRQYMQAL